MYKLDIPINNCFLVSDLKYCGSGMSNRCAWLEVYSARCGLTDETLVRDGEHCIRTDLCKKWYPEGKEIIIACNTCDSCSEGVKGIYGDIQRDCLSLPKDKDFPNRHYIVENIFDAGKHLTRCPRVLGERSNGD